MNGRIYEITEHNFFVVHAGAGARIAFDDN